MKVALKNVLITSILIFFVSIGGSLGAAFLYGLGKAEIIRNTVFAMVSVVAILFVFNYGRYSDTLDYDNGEHPYRFTIVYLGSFVISLLFPLMDKGGWAFLCIGIALQLFSNALTGITAVTFMILNCTLLTGGKNPEILLVYLIPVIFGVVLFRDIDENFNVALYIVVCMIALLVCETAGFIVPANEKLNVEQFIMPIVNIAINTVAIFGVLKFFNRRIANRYRDKFFELNDQEYAALLKLKEKSKTEYFRSIHTAYLVERMAIACNCNVDIAKNCAYYHRYKKAFALSNTKFNDFLNENEFPPSAKEALLEYYDKKEKYFSKESCMVYLSDMLISTIQALFAKNPKAEINYSELIDTMMNKEYVKAAIGDSDLSFNDMNKILAIMKKENLYYDFLR